MIINKDIINYICIMSDFNIGDIVIPIWGSLPREIVRFDGAFVICKDNNGVEFHFFRNELKISNQWLRDKKLKSLLE
jgi:hypothetical protein